MQYLTYISVNVPSINQFHSKKSELLSENKTFKQNFNLIVDPARHTDQRPSFSRNFWLKNPAKNHCEMNLMLFSIWIFYTIILHNYFLFIAWNRWIGKFKLTLKSEFFNDVHNKLFSAQCTAMPNVLTVAKKIINYVYLYFQSWLVATSCSAVLALH